MRGKIKKIGFVILFLIFVSFALFYTNQISSLDVSYNSTVESIQHNWIRDTLFRDITYDSNNKLVYLVGSSGVFGVYNRTSNTTENLNMTDTDNWISSNALYSISYDSNNKLIYLGGYSGVFGVYNRTSNVTEDLRATDPGNWIGSNSIEGITHDLNSNLIYLGGENGVFGVYNRTSNTTTVVAPLTTSTTTNSTTDSGSAATTIPSIKVTSTETISVPSGSSTSPVTVSITNDEIEITGILININTLVSGVSITVNEIDILSKADFNIAFPDGTSYQAFQILTGGLNETMIENATINFRVDKNWLLDNNYTLDDVILYRKQDTANQWDPLGTDYLDEDANYYYFSSVTPGFSLFSIFVNTAECALGEKRCFEEGVQICSASKKWSTKEICSYKCLNGKCSGREIFLLYIMIGILFVGGIISFIAKRISDQKAMKVHRSSLRR
jgi:PGF-pre-PGF domain-containing protein